MRKEALSPDEQRNWFLGLLSRRSYTRQEAARRLKDRGVSDGAAAALLGEAQEMGLLDDAAYARLFAEGHASWGNDRIAYELRRRGISSEGIQSALEEVDEEERLRVLIEPWLEGGLEMRKIIARLQRRGFNNRTIWSVCNEDDGEA